MRRRWAALAAVALCLAPGVSRAQAKLTGVVYDSLFLSAPLPRATVAVVGTVFVTAADERGRFRFDSIPAGRYEVTFFHPSLDSIGLAAPVATVEVPADGEVKTLLGTPSPMALRRLVCPELADPSTGVLIGRVRDAEKGEPLADAEVSSSWLEVVFKKSGPASEPQRVSTRSNAAGLFALCGFPIDVPVFVRGRQGNQTSGPVEVYARNREVVFQHLAVSLADTSARASVDSVLEASTLYDTLTRPPGMGRLVGHVRDAGGRIVKGARVSVMGANAIAVANDEGTFRLGGLPAGSQTVEIRAIGYAPSRRTVELSSGDIVTSEFEIDRRAQEMPKVQVMGANARAGRTGFAARERQGLGHFVNADRIRRMGGATAMDLIMHLPGVMPEYRTSNGRTVRRVTMRGALSIRDPSGKCLPNLYIDGMLWFDAWDQIENFFMKDDIVGVEVYSSLGSIPPQFFRANGCGSIVLWTRH